MMCPLLHEVNKITFVFNITSIDDASYDST